VDLVPARVIETVKLKININFNEHHRGHEKELKPVPQGRSPKDDSRRHQEILDRFDPLAAGTFITPATAQCQ
jgi:hypothetical protein